MAGWCDKLASTPTVGFRLEPNFVSGDSLLSAITAITNKYYEKDKPKFTMERHESFSVQFSTEDGYTYSIDATRVSVAFAHKMRAKLTSGGPPIMEPLTEMAPYTDLLKKTIDKTVHLASSIPSQKGRKLQRVGIVATTVTNERDMPPGVAKLLKYFGRPWNNELRTYHLQIGATLDKSDTQEDRCIYTISKMDEHEELTTFSFDWQRFFPNGKSIEERQLQETMRLAERAALSYFEEIAEGNQWDEKLIGIADK